MHRENAFGGEEGLMRRKGKFDAIVVETTGLADPAPVAQTFFMDEQVGAKTKLDAVVTVPTPNGSRTGSRTRPRPRTRSRLPMSSCSTRPTW